MRPAADPEAPLIRGGSLSDSCSVCLLVLFSCRSMPRCRGHCSSWILVLCDRFHSVNFAVVIVLLPLLSVSCYLYCYYHIVIIFVITVSVIVIITIVVLVVIILISIVIIITIILIAIILIITLLPLFLS